jgi:hypothetical protein
MHRRYTVHAPGAWTLMFVFLVRMLLACSNGSSGGAGAGSPDHVDGGPHAGDASVAKGSKDSGMPKGADDGSPDGSRGSVTTTADGSAQTDDDGGVADDAMMGDSGALTYANDAQTDDDAGLDGSSGPRDIGSCCEAQSTPGCSNPDLEVCVCEKDPSCCMTVWDAPCALIVEQKFCQSGVRDCVCGSDAGEWNQTQCCTTDWTSTCDSVATLKCSAVQGCF